MQKNSKQLLLNKIHINQSTKKECYLVFRKFNFNINESQGSNWKKQSLLLIWDKLNLETPSNVPQLSTTKYELKSNI